MAYGNFFKFRGRESLSESVELEDISDIDFFFLGLIVRPAHILPPLYKRPGPPRFIATDLVDLDMFFRLLYLK